jgi:hypothetical protein
MCSTALVVVLIMVSVYVAMRICYDEKPPPLYKYRIP